MRYYKSSLRSKFILKRKKKSFSANKFNFNLIFKLIKNHFYGKKVTIAGYYPSNYEVDILKFLEEASKKNFKIALPVIKTKTSMNFKLWSFMEPKNSEKKIVPDLILVPLVAFDNQLNRIGYGKGYYDRSLIKIKKNKKNSISLGIAYSFQKCSNVPVNKYDFKLDYILTERGIISSN
jgi:5-formyltetrahydrofolate cyclo-ligase